MSSDDKAESKKKRGPGRPSKKQPPPTIECKGIVPSPKNPDHKMEMYCQAPKSFKDLFVYFKNVKAHKILMRCTREGIAFFTRAEESKTRIMVWAAGKNLAWYYYADSEPFFCAINREHVEAMFNSINKSFNVLQIQLRNDTRDKITFVLKDPEIDKECLYETTLGNPEVDNDLLAVERLITEEELRKYPIEFTLSAKQLKKTISDASNQATNELHLQKMGTSHLQFTHNITGQQQYYEIYKKPEKINLRSEVKDGDSIDIEWNLKTIKMVANSMVTDSVKIYCNRIGEIVFRSAIDDKALNVSAFVDKMSKSTKG